jgi:DNA-binding CsgD family transcriptional regulator
MPLSALTAYAPESTASQATGLSDETYGEIATHTRQLAVSLLVRPVRAERAKVLVDLVLDDAQFGPSSYIDRLLGSVLVDVHLQLGDRDAAQALCNRIDLCSGASPADSLISVRSKTAIALFDAQTLSAELGDESDVALIEPVNDALVELTSRLEVLAADTGGDLLERARAALLVGRSWARSGREHAAAAWLESASVLFERAGQPQWSRASLDEASIARDQRLTAPPLFAMGAPPTDGTPVRGSVRLERPQQELPKDWQVGLTPAERRVALLIGGGRSNREAAAELFVSVKTVESHVQSVFRKLGMHRRSELANLVGRTLAA